METILELSVYDNLKIKPLTLLPNTLIGGGGGTVPSPPPVDRESLLQRNKSQISHQQHEGNKENGANPSRL